jgi:hypothetical protein
MSEDGGKRSQVNELALPLRANAEEALHEIEGRPVHAARRLACYHKVVQALIHSHGIGDDDPEEAMRRDLRRLEDVGEAGGCDEGAAGIAEQARTFNEEVRE